MLILHVYVHLAQFKLLLSLPLTALFLFPFLYFCLYCYNFYFSWVFWYYDILLLAFIVPKEERRTEKRFEMYFEWIKLKFLVNKVEILGKKSQNLKSDNSGKGRHFESGCPEFHTFVPWTEFWSKFVNYFWWDCPFEWKKPTIQIRVTFCSRLQTYLFLLWKSTNHRF